MARNHARPSSTINTSSILLIWRSTGCELDDEQCCAVVCLQKHVTDCTFLLWVAARGRNALQAASSRPTDDSETGLNIS